MEKKHLGRRRKKTVNVTNVNTEYTCIMGYYSLDNDENIEDLTVKDKFSSPKASDLETLLYGEETYFYEKKPYKLAKKLYYASLVPKTDALLYNTGAIVYIINSKKWFRDYKPVINLKPIIIGNGPIIPYRIGIVAFKVLYKKDPD